MVVVRVLVLMICLPAVGGADVDAGVPQPWKSRVAKGKRPARRMFAVFILVSFRVKLKQGCTWNCVDATWPYQVASQYNDEGMATTNA